MNFKRMRKKIFILIPIVLFLYLAGCYQVNEPEVINKSLSSISYSNDNKLKKINGSELLSDMKTIAKKLAILMKDDKYREILQKRIENANNRENIIDLAIFLNEEIAVGNDNLAERTSILKEIIKKTINREEEDIVKKYPSLMKGIFDIYFPVKIHRATWTSDNTQLLVAVSDPREGKKPDGKIFAYDIDGKEIMLSTQKAPEVPVLIISPSETHGKYPPKYNKKNYVMAPVITQSILDPTEPGAILNNDLIVCHVFLRDDTFSHNIWDIEYWGEGDPELYTIVKAAKIENGFKLVEQRTDFFEVVDQTLYILDKRILHIQGDVYTDQRIVEWWEEDSDLLGEDDLIESNWGPTDDNSLTLPYITATTFDKIWWGSNDDIWMLIHDIRNYGPPD